VRAALATAWEFAHDRDEAEDLTQEAFVKALQHLHRFDDRRSFRPWFFTILRNLARNAATRSKRARRFADALPAESSAPDDEVQMVVERQLSKMTTSQASCFRLCEIEGFSAVEVAEMLGMAAATVRTHVHRARLKLRAELGRLGYGSQP
jgi:RNA polymerase sigma factor (sigma-70 family)